jgi:hypothetical protein
MRRKEERLYRIWMAMRARCRCKNISSYKYYGGRGIKVCKEWNNYLVFKEWALSNGYDENLSIDRINHNGNYEPSNCRWTTAQEQANNKRNNHLITINGESHTLAEWSKLSGINYSTIRSRINRDNLKPEEVLLKKKLYRDKETGKFFSI